MYTTSAINHLTTNQMPNRSLACTAALIIISSLFAACGKKGSPVPTPNKQKPEVVVVVPPPIVTKVFLPVKLESDQETVSLTYLKDTGFLTGIETTTGVKELYTYTNKNELKQYDRYKKINKEYTVYYVLDQNGNVTQGNQNNVEGDGTVLTPTGSYTLAYNSDGRLSAVNRRDHRRQSIGTSERSFAADGNVVKLTSSEPAGQSLTFTYDDKNGIFQNVKFRDVLSIESLPHLLFAARGNLISESDENASSNNIVYSYTYGSDNYPTAMTIIDSKNKKKVYKITYR
jgi:YD repeat-containing protein